MEDTVEQQVQQHASTLEEGVTSLMSVRPVSGGKIQLEFGEIIPTPESNSVVGDFNQSDERFTPRNARRAWLSAEPADAKRLLPEKVHSQLDACISEGEKQFIGQKGIKLKNGDNLRIQVNETHTPQNDWQEENLDRAAKQDGQGNYMLASGMLIFSNTEVVKGEASHTFIEHEETTTDPWSASYDVPQRAEQSSIAEEEVEEEVGETQQVEA